MATSRSTSRFICSACRHQLQPARRAFTSAAPLRADASFATDALSSAFGGSAQRPSRVAPRRQSDAMSMLNSKRDSATIFKEASQSLDDPDPSQTCHRLYVYATKHNTHITLSQPKKSAMATVGSSVSTTSASAADRKKMVDTLISLSTGNIGFRKSGRGSYDAAFQLGAFVMKQIQEKGMLGGIERLEIVLRGFGAGRQAVEKILLGTEGRLLRSRVIAVMDATRLKFGGTRSPRPRRLG